MTNKPKDHPFQAAMVLFAMLVISLIPFVHCNHSDKREEAIRAVSHDECKYCDTPLEIYVDWEAGSKKPKEETERVIFYEPGTGHIFITNYLGYNNDQIISIIRDELAGKK